MAIYFYQLISSQTKNSHVFSAHGVFIHDYLLITLTAANKTFFSDINMCRTF